MSFKCGFWADVIMKKGALLAERRPGEALVGRSGRSAGRRLSGGLGKASEGLGVADGDVGQHLAVQLDAGQLEPVHEGPVAHPVLPRGGVDAGDPQAAEVALAVAAIAIGVGVRLDQRFLGALVVRVRFAAVALRQRQDGAALLLGVQRALDASHGYEPSRRSFLTRGASLLDRIAGLPWARFTFGLFFSKMWLVKA